MCLCLGIGEIAFATVVIVGVVAGGVKSRNDKRHAFIIATNPNKSEWSCTTRENWDKNEFMRVDVDDLPMEIIHEFMEESTEAAFEYNKKFQEKYWEKNG